MKSELKTHQQKHHNHKVVMLVYPLQGHINPMLQLATLLQSKGFSIILAYPLDLINLANTSSNNNLDFTYLPLKANVRGTVAECSPRVDGVAGVIELTAVLNELYREPFEKSMKDLMECSNEGEMGSVRCIVYDAFMYFGQSVADECKIPGVNLRTSCVASVLGIIATNGPSYELGSNVSLQVPIPELQALELDSIGKRLKETAPKMSVNVQAEVSKAFTKSKAIVVNTMGFLEQAAISKAQEFLKAHIYPIGPLHKFAQNPSKPNSIFEEDPSCITWLDQHPPRSVLYVSFGSLACMTEEDFHEAALGLVQSKQPFLWVVRPGSIRGGREWADILPRSLVECIEKSGCIVGWAPQRQVLAHGSVGGFWTHCGWNSTIECVCEGVPMICRPFFGDQFWNANYICKVWKIGVEFEGVIESCTVERVVKELLVGKEGQNMRQWALELKSKVESCVKEGGSSHTYINQLVKCIISHD